MLGGRSGKQQKKFINRGLVCSVHVPVCTWIDCSSIMTGNSDFRLNNTQSHFEVGILHSTRCVCTIIPLLSTHVNEKYRWWLSYHMGLQDFNGTWQGINCQEIVEGRWWQIRIYNSLTSYELPTTTLDFTLCTICGHDILWVINTLSTEIFH